MITILANLPSPLAERRCVLNIPAGGGAYHSSEQCAKYPMGSAQWMARRQRHAHQGGLDGGGVFDVVDSAHLTLPVA
jgi:hypothetical protein